MPTLLIVSTSPGAGKTAVGCWIAAKFVAAGRKPALTSAFVRAGTAGERDPEAMARLVPGSAPGTPTRIQTTFPQLAQIPGAAAAINRLSDRAAPIIVEGLSGSPELNLRLAEELDAQILIVAAWGDDPLAAARTFGRRTLGVIYNALPRYREHTLRTKSVPALDAAGVPFLGAIPDDRHLLAVTITELAAHLDGKIVDGEDRADGLVDYFLVGGNIWDWGVHYFGTRENAAAVIRGDRPDIQMAALATPIKALVLTAGKPPVPIQYVQYEAREEGVPLITVPHDTHKTAARLETVQERARFDHPGKLLRLQQIAEGAVSFGRIEESLAVGAVR
ncbi:MAG: phosphotransacetylase family protein [SAR202 cluster bacterium]|nr:phosphotransacetylase family protein [SAR202 cluster bacterium]